METKIEPTVDYFTPGLAGASGTWGPRQAGSSRVRESYNDADDGTPVFAQDRTYVMERNMVVFQGADGNPVLQIVRKELKGSQIVQPGGQRQANYSFADYQFAPVFYRT